MIEINKKIYLDENNNKNNKYKLIKKIIQEAIKKIIEIEKHKKGGSFKWNMKKHL